MMVIGLVSFSFVLLVLIFILLFLYIRAKRKKRQEILNSVKTSLQNQGYIADNVLYINSSLSLMLNRSGNVLYVVRNNESDSMFSTETEEVLIQFIKNFEITNNTIILRYFKSGEEKNLVINPINDEIKKFIHDIFVKSCLYKIKEKIPNVNFSLYCPSDYLCSYFWAYNPLKSIFCYLKLDDTIKKPLNYKAKTINLLKENFTIDVKYNYFEAPIDGIAQQLSLYDDNFLSDLFYVLIKSIKSRYSLVKEDMIYYNSLSNVVYLTNGASSLLGLRLDEVFEVEYSNSKLSFLMRGNQRTINYITTRQFISEFQDFVTGCNLRKIANNFNYSTDKLINATENTKFIVDFSRSRFIYCANIDTFSHFNFIIFSFYDVDNVKLENNANSIFVRIFKKDNTILDVSCNKYEVAEYLMAVIRKIMDDNYNL